MRTNIKKAIALLIAFSAAAFAQEKGTFTDTRDKKTYKTVKIGEQTWMAENLNYNASGSKCYEGKPANCTKYGRLYNWNTAMKACPSGWHLPSNAEWQTLVNFAGGEEVAGKALKASSGCDNNGNGEDSFGFAALPSGHGSSGNGFAPAGSGGYWWTSSELQKTHAFEWEMNCYDDEVRNGNCNRSYLQSVRCVQD